MTDVKVTDDRSQSIRCLRYESGKWQESHISVTGVEMEDAVKVTAVKKSIKKPVPCDQNKKQLSYINE